MRDRQKELTHHSRYHPVELEFGMTYRMKLRFKMIDTKMNRQRERELTHHSGYNPVEPQLGLAEQDEGEPPDGIEPVGRSRLSQHAVEINL